MADLTNAQKKEWAKTLYLKENLTQQEIADRVGVSRVSVSNWVRAGAGQVCQRCRGGQGRLF